MNFFVPNFRKIDSQLLTNFRHEELTVNSLKSCLSNTQDGQVKLKFLVKNEQ